MTYEIGENVKIIWKEMVIPVKIADRRKLFGREEYQVELLEDGEGASDWITTKWIEAYENQS